MSVDPSPAVRPSPRHPRFVRITHWLTTVAFFALLLTGVEVILSHPRFYSYLAIVFVLFPLVIWTGLAMAPGFTAVFPFTVDLLVGRQSARTLYFFVTIASAQ